MQKTFFNIFKGLSIIIFLYLFLSSISMMSSSFNLLGGNYIQFAYNAITNPFLGLLLGVFSTIIVQSSSVTTSITVGLVSAGVLNLNCAVGIIMGANIGTTVTNTIVSLAYIKDSKFKTVFPAAIMHDIFNILTVIILFPIEMYTGFLRKTATFLASHLYGSSLSFSYNSPIKHIVKIPFNFIKNILTSFMSNEYSGITMIILSFIFIILSLFFIVKIMNNTINPYISKHLNKVSTKNKALLLLTGVIFTVLVQSSSVTTSLLIPLVGSGLISINSSFIITLGANIGTTVTALLAAISGNINGLIIALVHLLFNCTGASIAIIFNKQFILLVEKISNLILKNRWLALLYIVSLFSLSALFVFILS